MVATSRTSPRLVNLIAPDATPASSIEANAAGAIGGSRAALPFVRTSYRSVSSPVRPFRLMRALSSLTRPLALRSITHQPRPAYGCMLVCAPAGRSVSTRSTCVFGWAYQRLIPWHKGGRQRGGGRRAVRQGGRAAAAHLQRALEGGELLGRAVVLGAAPRALRHRDVVQEDAHLAAGAVLLLGLLVEELQHLCDLAQLQPVLVRVVGVEPVRARGGSRA